MSTRKEKHALGGYPVFDHDPKNSRGELLKTFGFQTSIRGYSVYTDKVGRHKAGYLQVIPSGELYIGEGFIWDYGSGPAIDTPAMIVASLAHDALCYLTDEALLPWKERKRADKYFRTVLKDYGTSWLRRQYCYLAVRIYSITRTPPD